MSLKAALLYWHTLRHLRPVQLYGRVWFRLGRPQPDLRAVLARREARAGRWIRPARREASMLGPDRFEFLSEARDLAAHGWDDPAVERLWRYNLHYFDDINAQDASAREAWHLPLMVRWVTENRPAAGTGWEPYPTSLRIVNWIKWSLSGGSLPAECLHSLAVQARWLTRRLETHLLGNHLFANGKALVFAGLFFDGVEAARWLGTGMAILSRQVPEQILADGGHFERSTMYHALALEDMLDLCNVTAVFAEAVPQRWAAVVAECRRTIAAMDDWLAAMCHPDGEIAFFNDAALGIAPSPAELRRYVAALGLSPSGGGADGVTDLAASGYLRIERGPVVALLDVAPVGPDYMPGHAHADTLSFELSAFSQRVLVNSGTSCYGMSAERLRQRGTAAHNTVTVDGQNSTEVWAGFRVARRARPVGLELVDDRDICVRCGHDGYRRLPGRPQHVRQWRFGGRSLLVEDEVIGDFGRAEARFHLHPAVLPEITDGGRTGRLRLAGGQVLTWSVEAGAPSLEKATYHPRFGVSEPTSCLVLRLQEGRSAIRFEWD